MPYQYELSRLKGGTHLESPEDGNERQQREAVLLLDAIEPIGIDESNEE